MPSPKTTPVAWPDDFHNLPTPPRGTRIPYESGKHRAARLAPEPRVDPRREQDDPPSDRTSGIRYAGLPVANVDEVTADLTLDPRRDE
jgi:hypothetical protein